MKISPRSGNSKPLVIRSVVDFPHPEGSWPNTAQYFKDNFSKFPVEDGRKILGENAVKFYGLDRERLQAVADEIGPTTALFN